MTNIVFCLIGALDGGPKRVCDEINESSRIWECDGLLNYYKSKKYINYVRYQTVYLFNQVNDLSMRFNSSIVMRLIV